MSGDCFFIITIDGISFQQPDKFLFIKTIASLKRFYFLRLTEENLGRTGQLI